MITQLEYDLHQAGVSQCEKILARLKENPGEWVAMPELYRVSGAFAVHSRISDLRKRGNVIEQRNEWEERVCKSSYRLLPEPKEARPHPDPLPQEREPATHNSQPTTR